MDRYLPQYPLPKLRYMPGKCPKDEKRDDIPKFNLQKLNEENWKRNKTYLYGIDLFNAGFYYEAHEVWEELWFETGKTSPEGQFLQALIQLSAAELKNRLREEKPAKRLLQSARKILLDLCEREGIIKNSYRGLSLKELLASLEKGEAPKNLTLQIL